MDQLGFNQMIPVLFQDTTLATSGANTIKMRQTLQRAQQELHSHLDVMCT
jgi:hypothetical protein